jgi:hypothetical protein
MTNSHKPVVVVGSVTMDMVTRTPQIPRIGQTVIGTSKAGCSAMRSKRPT